MKIKTILLAAAIGMAALSVNATLFITDINGGTNNVPGSTTQYFSHLETRFYPIQSKVLGVHVSFKLISAGTSNVVVQFSSSVNLTDWVTNSASVTLAASGMASVGTNITLNVQAIPFWRVESVQNGNAVALTNLLIHARDKPGVKARTAN